MDTQPPSDHVDTGSVTVEDRTDGRPSKFGVLWRVDGQRRKMFFKTAKSRNDKRTELERAAKRGTLELVPTRDDLRDWIAFKRATAPTPWQDVVAGWRESGKITCTTLIKTAVDDFVATLEKRVKDGTIQATTVAHSRLDILRFKDAFGGKRLDSPTSEEIVDWIDDLGFESPHTFNSKLRVVRAFYNDLVERELIRKSPAARIRLRDGSPEEVAINTVAEVAQLFAYALDHHREALGRLALESFAGIRFSSAYRLEKHDINFADKGILLPRKKLKTGMVRGGRRRYIDKLPENLWPWLEATNDACWAMEGSDWMKLKSRLFDDAKVPHPHNSMRHSFCTHHMAWLGDAVRTAAILCHTDQQLLWSTYNGIAASAAGKAYFEITPQSAAMMAKDPQILGLTYMRPTQPPGVPAA